MIRPFDWRDFGLVRRMTERGVCFDSEAALTRGPHTFQTALLAFLAPGAGLPTFVWRPDEDERESAFGQLRFRSGDDYARLIYFAPGYEDGGPWEALLAALAGEAAARGAHNLLAEVNEHSPECDALRKLGFAIYARQHIWRLNAPRPAAPVVEVRRLRPQQSSDSIGISTLYTNTVPRLVQQVEPAPGRFGRGYVAHDDGEVAAFFDVSRGPLGTWIQPYLHPSIFEESCQLLAELVNLFADRDTLPVYVCVRSHQDWLRTPLADLKFEAWAEQAVMVKRLAVRVAEPEFKPLPVIAGGQPSPPMIQSHFAPRPERMK